MAFVNIRPSGGMTAGPSMGPASAPVVSPYAGLPAPNLAHAYGTLALAAPSVSPAIAMAHTAYADGVASLPSANAVPVNGTNGLVTVTPNLNLFGPSSAMPGFMASAAAAPPPPAYGDYNWGPADSPDFDFAEGGDSEGEGFDSGGNPFEFDAGGDDMLGLDELIGDFYMPWEQNPYWTDKSKPPPPYNPANGPPVKSNFPNQTAYNVALGQYGQYRQKLGQGTDPYGGVRVTVMSNQDTANAAAVGLPAPKTMADVAKVNNTLVQIQAAQAQAANVGLPGPQTAADLANWPQQYQQAIQQMQANAQAQAMYPPGYGAYGAPAYGGGYNYGPPQYLPSDYGYSGYAGYSGGGYYTDPNYDPFSDQGFAQDTMDMAEGGGDFS